ncbi:MAG TPA: cyclic pyranopterin monophosphate synthase MoaC [Miltoncostaea sp.]|nr:cyclic pyranopterin monophosphate synthase MoaC [Miltoncostaea sp.]
MSDGPQLTHLDARGEARMVGVGHKPPVLRRAVAEAVVRMRPESARAMSEGTLPKGDAAAVARIAGIMAAKRTPELVALCHPLPIDKAGVEVAVDPDAGTVTITASVETTARTGVEMEALTAASVAALNVYDLVKGIDTGIVIEQVRLLEKTKGDAG